MAQRMVQPHPDICRILTKTGGAWVLLAVATMGILALSNTTQPAVKGNSFTTPLQTGTSYANLAQNGALNLTYANVNSSRPLQQNTWTANSTTAQTTINSSDAQGETVSAVWRLNQTSMIQAQIIKYDFQFSTQVLNPGPSGPRLNATVELASSDYQGWYTQSRTPAFSNNTETIGVTNVVGSYSNGSAQKIMIFDSNLVTDGQVSSPAGNSAVLFQRRFAGYAAGDGVLHHYTIEIDRQSNQTIWIADASEIATFKLSFVPSNLVFSASASGVGDLAVTTLEAPVQTAIPIVLTVNGITFGIAPGSSTGTMSITGSSDQISSLQKQIDHLNNQLGNLTTQNAQLQAKGSQWFAQWWAVLIWGFLGAAVGGSFFVAESKLRMNGKGSDEALTRADSTCPHCGREMPHDAAFCGECGNLLRETKPICPECGELMPAAAAYCGDCGTQIAPEGQPGQSETAPLRKRDTNENDGTWR